MILNYSTYSKFINTIKQHQCILVRSPMRVSLCGGGTDLSWYSSLRGGAWISAAINRYVYVGITKNLQGNSPFSGSNCNKIITACLSFFPKKYNIDIHIYSDVSPGSGLGGSGAFETSLLYGLFCWYGEKIDKMKLAKLSADVEIKHLHRPVGPQDQYISALGGLRAFQSDKKGNIRVQLLSLDRKIIRKLENNLVFFSTNYYRNADYIFADLKKKILYKNQSEKIIKVYDKIKQLGLLAKQYLLTGRLDEFGRTFHQHWLIKRSLSDKISSTTFDRWYNMGIRLGALGGKIIGAGGGGWFVFYVNSHKTDFVKQMEKTGLKSEKVTFDWKGTEIIENSV